VSLVSFDTRALQAPPGALYDGAALTFQIDPREEQMVAALKQGDDRAFGWLVNQHHAMLVRLALRYPDQATAEDVRQETWLQRAARSGSIRVPLELEDLDRQHLDRRLGSQGVLPGRSSPVPACHGRQKTGQLLGAQIVRPWQAEVAKRIDVNATGLFFGMTVDGVNDLDLSYTPPVGSPCDAVQVSARAWERAWSAKRLTTEKNAELPC
jgi:hypothetical protein